MEGFVEVLKRNHEFFQRRPGRGTGSFGIEYIVVAF